VREHEGQASAMAALSESQAQAACQGCMVEDLLPGHV